MRTALGKSEGIRFSPKNRHLLTLARTFAQGMHGASLLYNLIAAERVAERPNAAAHDEADTLAKNYADQLEKWPKKVDFEVLDPWRDLRRRAGHRP